MGGVGELKRTLAGSAADLTAYTAGKRTSVAGVLASAGIAQAPRRDEGLGRPG